MLFQDNLFSSAILALFLWGFGHDVIIDQPGSSCSSEVIGYFLSLPERSPSIRVPVGYVSPFVKRVPIVLSPGWDERCIVVRFLR